MTRIACIGGFLGAGKTTALIEAARILVDRGKKVGIITNDQGHHLVDTELVRSFGFPSEEIGGGCFCCRFSDFARTAARLVEKFQTDVILAEAVGSCTDLSATVCQRLRRSFSGEFAVAPLTVMVDPERLREMLRVLPPFDEDVRYLFGRQLAEADQIMLAKADLLGQTEIARLQADLRHIAGEIPVSVMSAKSGSGVNEWVDLILAGQANARRIDVDYDRYGVAEAALGWLNATIDLSSDRQFLALDCGEALIGRIQQACREEGLSVAHIKILFVTPDGSDWIALTDAQGTATWGVSVALPACREVAVIINARVCARPEQLQALIENSLSEVTETLGLIASVQHIESFAPSPPAAPVMAGGE